MKTVKELILERENAMLRANLANLRMACGQLLPFCSEDAPRSWDKINEEKRIVMALPYDRPGAMSPSVRVSMIAALNAVLEGDGSINVLARMEGDDGVTLNLGSYLSCHDLHDNADRAGFLEYLHLTFIRRLAKYLEERR